MSILHFSTEVSGGAGAFVSNVHQSMLSTGIKSTIVSREYTNLNELQVVKPFNRWQRKIRSLKLKFATLFNLIDPKYALFPS